MMRKARTVLGALQRPLDALLDRLTPGQQWTSALALALVTVVVLFGSPPEQVLVRPPDSEDALHSNVEETPASQPPQPRPADAEATTPTAPHPDSGGLAAPPTADEAGAPPQAPAEGTDEPTEPPSFGDRFSGEAAPDPDFVALVRTETSLPGRDEASVAAAYLEDAAFDAAIVEIDEEDLEQTCLTAAGEGAAGGVVLASHEPPTELRECLLGLQATFVAYDQLGQWPQQAGDQVVSTRRQVAAAVGDVGDWALSEGILEGAAVGLAGTVELEPQLEHAREALEARGVQVAETAYLDADAEGAQEVPGAARSFMDAGIDTILFALPVSLQRQWVTAQTALSNPLLGDDVAYLVADAYDAVLEEGYPASFDGARAVTSLRLPWQTRESEEPTPRQQLCRQRWEDHATPGATLDTDEEALAYMWCQHVLLVERGLAAANAEHTFEETLRSQELQSPLTSPLGPLPDDDFGPQQDAVLEWSAACQCWESREPFADRRE